MESYKDMMTTDREISSTGKGKLLLLFIACSFLVFVVGGYNNFIPNDIILISRIFVFIVFLIPTFILYKSKGELNSYWRISFLFLIVSIGFLLTWFFGTWHLLIPGLSMSTVEGAAIAKVAEVLPVILSILVGIWLIEKDYTPIYLRGGDLKKSIKLGVLVSPAVLMLLIPLGFLNITASLDTIVSWMPWIFVFSFSNALYEELMIRGIFLRSYDSIFGQRTSLLLTSFVFAMLHVAIIGLADLVTFTIYFGLSFFLGALWAYVIQKSDNIWGAVLTHVIGDILFVLTMFGV
ncbi:MAG: CPBP family intramembrane metalloprotease [Candidatus Thorarchaeota archaeon]|nr:CPBP family intramembrane metalloprotease [Candidatus Thorarchaeota archaeon]